MAPYTVIAFLLVSVTFSNCLLTRSMVKTGRIQRESNTNDDPGDPLVLTKLIENNRIPEAQKAANVTHPDFKGVVSYSGYFTVNKKFNSNLFFWFFPAANDYKNAPVVLWLQGGPGGSSLFGLFAENGPFAFTGEDKIELRKHTWSKDQSVIYIDNPAGTGFSNTTNEGLCRDQTQVGEELYEALRQFFLLFPELQNNDFFITGESYAGKYIPATATTIHHKNKDATLKINLKGIAIGDGYSDPIHQNEYSTFLYQTGLIDADQKHRMMVDETIMRAYIDAGSYLEASYLFDELMQQYTEYSGLKNPYHYLQEENPLDTQNVYIAKYVQRNDIRKALHVGNMTYHGGDEVHSALQADMTKSVAPLVADLIENYRVLIYNGLVDVIVAYPLTSAYLQNLDFKGKEVFQKTERKMWYSGDKLAGYVKEAGKLQEVAVRNAGHMVPTDQPEWAYDLIYRFTRNITLS